MHSWSGREIIAQASACVEQYRSVYPHAGYTQPFIIHDMYDAVIYPEYEIVLNMTHDLGLLNGTKILGRTDLDTRAIFVDRSLVDPVYDPRFAFTLAHEIGHALLHVDRRTRHARLLLAHEDAYQEKEADLFAEHLLMPEEYVRHQYHAHYQRTEPLRYAGIGTYVVSNNYSFYASSLFDFCRHVAQPLTPFFSCVSTASMAYRLMKLHLMVNETNESLWRYTR